MTEEVKHETRGSIVSKLLKLQALASIPKKRVSPIGGKGFAYRNCEDILVAMKPHCFDEGLALVLTDTIEQINGRFYVRATASLVSPNGESVSVNGWARELDEYKGMAGAWLTGACSSYARKYALNALFAIDDSELDLEQSEGFVEISDNTCRVKTRAGMVDIKEIDTEKLKIILNNENYISAKKHIEAELLAREQVK